MAHIARDGTVGGRKSISRAISDFFMAIYQFIALFFTTIMNPAALEGSSSRRTYAQRNGGRSYNSGSGRGGGSGGQRLGRGGNIRGVCNLQGPATARMGGG